MQEILSDHRNFISIGGRSAVCNLRFTDHIVLIEGSNIALLHFAGSTTSKRENAGLSQKLL